MDLEAELERLYGVSLERFTEERNAIARAAKKAGDDDAAAAVKALKKPSVGAWTINQLVRRHPDEIAELLRVRDELEGAASPQRLRDLSGRRREIVARLASLARSILAVSGHGASHQTVEKVSQGLLAGGTGEERQLLENGRLTREPSASGLEAFGFAPAELEEEPATKVPLKEQRRINRLRREAESLQQEAARLEQEASLAEEHARRARAKADEASQAANAASERAAAAADDAGL